MLSDAGVPLEERRYFTDPPTREEIEQLAARLPGGVMDLVSTRGRRFKELNLAGVEKSTDEWIELLMEEPRLWRRPIAVFGDKIIVGFDADALDKLAEEVTAGSQ